MSPRSLGAWALSGVTIALATGNPVYRVLVLLCALNVVMALRRPGVSLRGLLIALVVYSISSPTGTQAPHPPEIGGQEVPARRFTEAWSGNKGIVIENAGEPFCE